MQIALIFALYICTHPRAWAKQLPCIGISYPTHQFLFDRIQIKQMSIRSVIFQSKAAQAEYDELLPYQIVSRSDAFHEQ